MWKNLNKKLKAEKYLKKFFPTQPKVDALDRSAMDPLYNVIDCCGSILKMCFYKFLACIIDLKRLGYPEVPDGLVQLQYL